MRLSDCFKIRFPFSLITGIAILFYSLTLHAAPIHVTDSRGEQVLEQIPTRVVVLDWSLLEQVIELQIIPIAGPELDSYAQWVVQPAVPEGVSEIGMRSEPNLEKIAMLKPDLILAGNSQQDLLAQLAQIAPVLYYSNFSEQQQHAEVAIQQFRQLAVVFNKELLAEQKLTSMQNHFKQLKQKLMIGFSGQLPEVVTMRFANKTSVFLYAENSTTEYVTQQLGLTITLPQPPEKWGIVQQRLTKLKDVSGGYVLYFLPFAEEKQLQQSVLWRAMPFVRKNHVNAVRSVWNYGGAMSLLYLGEAITDSLLEVAPAS